ncbi:MAG: MarR family winged helix-turn-helix transcriptional regulator [Salibacteraceae bacterium]
MNIEDSILPFLGRTVKSLELYIEDRFYAENIPLSKMQFVFLRIISMNNKQPQNNLAQLVGRDKTTLTRNINTLEKKGLVNRQTSPIDKRVKLIEITSKGEKLLERAYPIIKSIIKTVESDISEKERNQFKSTLTKIRTKLNALGANQIQ